MDTEPGAPGGDRTARSTGDGPSGRGGDRRHRFPGRRRQVFVRLSDDEYQTITEAAARVELTPTGYVAEAALAHAQHLTDPTTTAMSSTGITRSELARLQRELFAARTAVNHAGALLHQAITTPYTTGRTPPGLATAAAAVRRTLHTLDTLAAVIDRRLR